jgi:dihydrofolate reductase
MNHPRVSIIAAVAKNRVIGNKNQLPWHIKEDLQRFKRLTEHHVVVMGKNTYRSIGRPLPRRTNIVISDEAFEDEQIIIARSLDEALEKAKGIEPEEIFIIGGAMVYKETIHLVDRLYLTEIDRAYEGDTFFPDYGDFTKIIEEQKGEGEDPAYRFLTLER